MKEVEKKDVPGISGGQDSGTAIYVPAPHPVDFPPAPGGPVRPGPIGPINPIDPLGDAVSRL
jgi:hypothetical protein